MITPHTIRSFKGHAEFLETADLSPIGKGLKKKHQEVCQGRLSSRRSGCCGARGASKTIAAELARINIQNRTRRSVQKGGILYADGARTMVCRRQEDDAEAKIRCAQIELERAQKTARRDMNKKWKPVFQELKRTDRERNARLKQQQK